MKSNPITAKALDALTAGRTAQDVIAVMIVAAECEEGTPYGLDKKIKEAIRAYDEALYPAASMPFEQIKPAPAPEL